MLFFFLCSVCYDTNSPYNFLDNVYLHLCLFANFNKFLKMEP